MTIYQIYERRGAEDEYKKIKTDYFFINDKFLAIKIPESNIDKFEQMYHDVIPIVYTLFPDIRIVEFMRYLVSIGYEIKEIKFKPEDEDIEMKINTLIRQKDYDKLFKLIEDLIEDIYSIEYIGIYSGKVGYEIKFYKWGTIYTEVDLKEEDWRSKIASWILMLVPR